MNLHRLLGRRAEEGKPVEVVVELSGDLIRVTDNGEGMSRKELQNFFMMHGENIQRARGKRVRGRFGTGKCAAFGIANLFRVDTVKNKKRNVVELSRSSIEAAKSGSGGKGFMSSQRSKQSHPRIKVVLLRERTLLLSPRVI